MLGDNVSMYAEAADMIWSGDHVKANEVKDTLQHGARTGQDLKEGGSVGCGLHKTWRVGVVTEVFAILDIQMTPLT